MADFLLFSEGANHLLDKGVTGTAHYALSRWSTTAGKGVKTLAVGDTYAGGFGEITGTGYARAEIKPVPAASEGAAADGEKAFPDREWKTGEAEDWPNDVRSVVLVCEERVICAWNLQTGAASGEPRDLSGANTTEHFDGAISF